MHKIAVIGTGYVGLVTGACFAEAGHDVVCVDSDADKIAMLRDGRSPIYEADLERLINNNKDRLRFTTDLAEGIEDRGFIFIAVGTPTGDDGRPNLSYIEEAAAGIGRALRHDDAVVVVKSTVPVGTNGLVGKIIRENLDEPRSFHVAFCPEFLREGTAVADIFHGDRVVIGADNIGTFERVAAIYRSFGSKIIHVSIASAEMIKYASNAFLATKISFTNEIANLCELLGADIEQVTLGMGLDQRIGSQFLRAGIGYGGSCFPKDAQALLTLAREHRYDFPILAGTVEVNRRQVERFLARIADYSERSGRTLAGAQVAVWGLAYKPGTDDVRDSPSLRVIPALAEKGCRLRLYDPAAMENFQAFLPDVPCDYAASAVDAARGADMLLILTEWDEFAGFMLKRLGDLMAEKLIFDGRNCFSPEAAAAHGFTYFSVGRPEKAGGPQ